MKASARFPSRSPASMQPEARSLDGPDVGASQPVELAGNWWSSASVVALAVAVGVAMAAALANFLPPDHRYDAVPEGLLPWVLHMLTAEPREKALIAGCAILGLGTGMLGALSNRVWRLSLPLSCAFFLVVCVLWNELLARTVRVGDAAAFGLLAAISAAVAWYALTRRPSDLLPPTEISFGQPWRTPPFHAQIAVCISILVLGLPVSMSAVAAAIGFDMHPVSYLIASALYDRYGDFMPGVGYYSQYSLGLGWLFSFVLPDSAALAVHRYTTLVVVGNVLFHLALFYLLAWLFEHWRIAAAITVAHLMLGFITERPFFAPSGTPLRYLLLPGVVAALAMHVQAVLHPGFRSIARARLLLAAGLALSIFLNLETGLALSLAVVVALMAALPTYRRTTVEAGLISMATVGLTLALLVTAHGWPVLSFSFAHAIIEPLLLFGGSGMGAWPVDWSGFGWSGQIFSAPSREGCWLNTGLCPAPGEWNLFYQVFAPGLALVTLALALARPGFLWIDRPRLAALCACACMAILMSAKFINMSLVALWHVNSLGFLIVLGWWWARANRCSPAKTWGTRVVSVTAVSLLLLITAFTADPRNPSSYGLQAWMRYPGLLQRFARGDSMLPCWQLSCMRDQPATEDIELIVSRTKEGEPVAIFDLLDWTFLIESKRAPLAPFLPSAVIFTQKQLDDYRARVAGATYLFVSADKMGFPFGRNTLLDDWPEGDAFVEEARGKRLIALRRKMPPHE